MAVETTTFECHRLDKDGPVATITFNRPEKRNAHNTTFFRELYEALQQAEDDDEVRVVVISSAGPVFCAGQDLKFTAVADKKATVEYGEWNRRSREKIHYLSKPVICRVKGPALGGGTYIATSCDLVVATKDARFQAREIHAGNQSGGMHILTIGKQRAMEMALLGRNVYAEEAERWGLINKCVENEEEADAQVKEWIDQLVVLPPLGLAATKRSSMFALELAGYMLMRKTEIGRDLFYTEDYREAKQSFVEKRKPVFKGR